jgi:hypothetical protein
MRLRRGAAVVSIALCGLFGLASDDWNVPQCREVPYGVRRLGWGLYGIRFHARKDEVEVRVGKPDVDYIVDVVKPKGSQAVLALWFGVNAWGLNDARNDIKNSERVSQRRINGAGGLTAVGGQLTAGTGDQQDYRAKAGPSIGMSRKSMRRCWTG